MRGTRFSDLHRKLVDLGRRMAGSRMDAHDGGGSGDTLGFTVLSSKDGTLYYSNNWTYDPVTLAWRTVVQDVNTTGGQGVVIN